MSYFKFIVTSLCLSISSVSFAVASSPMTSKELAVLLIHQKNYKDIDEKEKNPIKAKMRQEFAKIVGPIYASHIVGELKIPTLSLFKNQGALPVVLFNSCAAPLTTSNTAFIHSHGGPHVHIEKDTPHAEISYYLDNGFRIWCPNFRGSTGYGDAHKESGVGRLPAAAVQDVYLTAHALRASSPSLTPAANIILRGGSYGSCVNAHVLAMVNRGLKLNLFSGAHLVGGVKYPSAHEMPRDIPILIAHGVKDDVSPFELGARFALQLLYLGHENIEFIAGVRGDHHMISPMLTEEVQCIEYDELRNYVEVSTQFVDAINRSQTPKFTPVDSQIHSIEQLLRDINDVYPKSLSTESLIKIRKNLMGMFSSFAPALSLRPNPADEPQNFVGPTMSHLKLVLGSDYVPNVQRSLELFFQNHFKPYSWSKQIKDNERGSKLLADKFYMSHLREMVLAEEAHISKHPDDMVIYHAAPESGMRLYLFINIWRALVQGRSMEELSTMRMFDQHLCTFDDIHEFLGAMSGEFAMRKDKSKEVFNDVRGYPSRAIAGIPFLTASRHNTSSCSATWHFESRYVARHAPHKKVIAKLMKILGIYSPARVERYDEIFVIDQAEVATSDEQQSLMQQIFVPYDYADSHAYMSQIWGVRMGESQDDLSKPSIIKELIADPVSFENKLAQNKGTFTNPEEINYAPGDYMYTDLLQLRAVLRPGSTSRVNSFFRNPEQTNLLMERLQREILWDFADFIISRTQVPQSLIPNSNDFPNALRERTELSYYKTQHSTYVAYHVQKALTAPEHTRHGVFAGIAKCPDDVRLIMQGLDRETILDIQNKLIKKDLGMPPKKMCTYSVCYYLQGYTYHSLLLEAIQKTITDSPHERYAADMKTKSQKILMGAMKMFANPSSVNEINIGSGHYENLRALSLSLLQHKRDNALHKFFQRSSEGDVYEDHLWGLELNNAIYSYLNYARESSKNNNSFKYRNAEQRDEHCFYKQVVKPIEDVADF